MFASAGLREEGIKRIIATADRFVAWHLAIGLDAVLEAEKLPARITNLDTTLSNVQAKNLAHGSKEKVR
jgi:hypothetical protein